jgi:hypothetical protein
MDASFPTTLPPAADVADLISRADSGQIRARLALLEAEQRALRTLLRSVVARERVLARRQREEVTHGR